ncbi:MAG: GDSL-type esterase/lipase family protein [Lachnospira sp.]
MNTLWVIGDSTLSAFNDKYYYPRYGYGTMLSCYLNDNVVVNNIALSGRSSLSFKEEPEYRTLLNGMKSGDYLIIGFGHNDEKSEKDRYTNPNGDYKEEGTFANSLYVNYIKPATECSVTVILCTPIVRRSADGVWKQTELHITKDSGEFKGGDYAQAVRKLGKDLDIPVVDMTELTKVLYDELTPEETINLHAWPSNNRLSVDNTHTNIWGARVNAHIVMSEIKKLNIGGLSENIIGITEDNPFPSKAKYLVPNSDYVPTVFDSNLKDSKLFPECDGFKPAVFGDVLGPISKDNFILEKDSDGRMHIAVRNNKGKISNTTDGIAMYYKKLKSDSCFRFTAKLRVNDYFSNDQVSFGLMVRDDMYVDVFTPDILGDFVAAAPLLITRKEKAVSSFARRNGALIYGGMAKSTVNTGDEIEVELCSTADGYSARFHDGPTVTGGFDFKLTAIDSEHVYVGMFVSRNADITFYDYKLEEY